MGLPKVAITLGNGNLGRSVATADGVAGLLLTGIATDALPLFAPKVIFSLEEAVALGITATTTNVAAYRHIKEFYDLAGNGAELHLMLVNDSFTLTQMADVTNEDGAKKLLDAAQGRVRLLGLTRQSPTTDSQDGIDKDSLAAVLKAQQLALAYAAQYKPVRILVEGKSVLTESIATVKDLRTLNANHVGVVIGSTTNDGSAAVGLVLGRAAAIPVQRNLGRVKDGALPVLQAYINTRKAEEITSGDLLHDKGYIFFRSFAGRSGYFLNDDPMCAPVTDDYSQLSLGRVIDKATIICYQTYLEELNDEISVDENGNLSIPVIKYLQNKIETAVNLGMADEISAFHAFIDAAQNVISTGKLTVKASIVPMGYTKKIDVLLGFTNPALQQ
ncbi:DUF2586 family protein [Chitinophaga nivalis]|uniref:DUF2586 family protein n=1 Tax=Chitinophaga nivalis TaxID=2991709 RepID=A0ABT3IFE5_9BACT|nr:DUF2586 family protein [Chitinophaga nivalis]MCW3467636.1 DUF2586 family protein [Chitinophaga nivalis]MCW3482672.1 DUF2586 family protein [Chitinophaga nivalis]